MCHNMKQLLLIILLSTAIFGQSGKSVLTQVQKDSIGQMIRDSVSYINVKSYGFSLDGSSDNTTILNNLIDSSPDSTTFYFPQGEYSILGYVYIDKTIFFTGDGKGKSILDFSSSGQLNIQNNFVFEGFTVQGSIYAIMTARCTTWVKQELDFVTIRNNEFKGCNVIFSGGNIYDEDYFIKELRFENNFVDSCFGGFEASMPYINLFITGNSFINMHDKAGSTMSCVYAGAAKSHLYTGEVIIANNLIDGVYCTNPLLGNYGMLIYADNAVITGNVFKNFTAPSSGGSNIFTNAVLYLAGSNFVVSDNIFYNAGETHALNSGQTIYTKGEADVGGINPIHNDNRIIANNIFYNDLDSACYAINMRSPAEIYNNEFIYMADNYVNINGIIRPGITSGLVDSDFEDKNIIISSNRVKANLNFITMFGDHLDNLIINDNFVDVGIWSLYTCGYTPTFDFLQLRGNSVAGRLCYTGAGIAKLTDISNNTVTALGTPVDVNVVKGDLNINNNIFIIDTSATLSTGIIDIYEAVPDRLNVTNILNNTLIVRNTLATFRPFIYIRGGKYFIEGNTFVSDSVAKGTTSYLRGIWIQDSTDYCKINNNKFVTFGDAGFQSGVYVYNGVQGKIDIKDNLFDERIGAGVYINAGTVSELNITGNDWNGTTFYNKVGAATVSLLSKRQNWGDGIYNLSEYADADSLYKVIYDFTNSVQDTIGIAR